MHLLYKHMDKKILANIYVHAVHMYTINFNEISLST